MGAEIDGGEIVSTFILGWSIGSIINFLTCSAFVVHGLCMLNKMGRDSNVLYWAIYVALTVFAFSVAIGPLYGYEVVPWSEIGLNLSAALALILGLWKHERRVIETNDGGAL